MRLLHAETLEFAYFTGPEAAPKYAILSHTWGDDEVTYEHMRANREPLESKVGFQKIRGCASQTIKDGLEYFWIDTCCIDKSSSAELSEAINSMFQWYQKAEVCYAYLIDVLAFPEGFSRSWARFECEKKLRPSRWFTRGWTLQELIAPRRLVFYALSWMKLGTREDFAQGIKKRTGIPIRVLLDPTTLPDTSVAQRMSWAAHRQTSRAEDLAYCLMGLFDVNMPMLYGEGEKAFIRLQEEIIKTSDDMSIFAWTDKNANFSCFRGLLAKSPSEFSSCTGLRCTPQDTIPPYRTTNKGIEISVQLDPQEEGQDEYIAWLHGVVDSLNFPAGLHVKKVGIHVQKVGKNQYARVDPDRRAIVQDGVRDSTDFSLTTFFVRQQIWIEGMDLSRASGIMLHIKDPKLKVEEVQPHESWKTTEFILLSRCLPTAVLKLYHISSQESYALEFDTRKPWQELLRGDKSWETSQVRDSSTQTTIKCRKRTQSLERTNIYQCIKMVLRRGVFDGQLKLLLSLPEFASVTEYFYK